MGRGRLEREEECGGGNEGGGVSVGETGLILDALQERKKEIRERKKKVLKNSEKERVTFP